MPVPVLVPVVTLKTKTITECKLNFNSLYKILVKLCNILIILLSYWNAVYERSSYPLVNILTCKILFETVPEKEEKTPETNENVPENEKTYLQKTPIKINLKRRRKMLK